MAAFPFEINLVIAYGSNRAIGKDNQLLWHLPNDLKHFKHLTLGKAILMGRKTYESIGRALPGRRMIVLTRKQGFYSDYAEIVHELSELNTLVKAGESLMVIGGAEIYQLCLPFADKIYATEVEASLAGDAFFPVVEGEAWLKQDEAAHPKDDRHAYPYTFITFARKK